LKRGTIEHPKTEILADLLGIPLVQAVGHLEALWHFTAKHARRGDLGRWPNKVIAGRCLWLGDPDRFIDALERAGWVDSDPSHRLLVHDWADHADVAVRKALQRSGETFANQTAEPAPRSSVQTLSDAVTTESGLPLPLPKPLKSSPQPEPRGGGRRAISPAKASKGVAEGEGLFAAEDIARRFWAARGDPGRAIHPSELGHAATLLARWGPERAIELVEKVAAKVKHEQRDIRFLGGVMRDIEQLGEKLELLDRDRDRRDGEAEQRRAQAAAAEAAKAVRLSERSARLTWWESLSESEREAIRERIRTENQAIRDAPGMVLELCLMAKPELGSVEVLRVQDLFKGDVVG
jgi:hypothetical protein